MLKQKKFQRALVVGAGSGRDFASAVLLTEKLRKSGAKVDLAGFLTPWALHTFEGKLEQPVNKLTRNSNKFTPNQRYHFLSDYFEPLLLDLNEELNLGLKNLYLLSLQHGMDRLQTQLQALVSSEKYDLILAADVGGDILAQKSDFSSIKTPIVDQSCLNLLKRLKTDAERVLAVVSPGVDGEIPIPRILDIVNKLRKDGSFLGEEIFFDSESFSRFLAVNEAINMRSGSYSHTFKMIRDFSMKMNGSSSLETYLQEIKIGNHTWMLKSPIKLDADLMQKIFYFDLIGLSTIDITYPDIFNAFLELKRCGVCATEIDFSHIPIGINDSAYESSLYMLTPATSINEELRKEMLLEGLRLVHSREVGKALIHKDDFALLGIYPGSALYSVDGYCFMSVQ
jgi:hypothetical protein